MEWISSLQKAINYIEENLYEELDIERISESVYASGAHFQRIFSIITGITIGDYIRFRRLTLAGKALAATEDKILDIAIKHRYETAESFTKAFIRFHGVTPSAAKKARGSLKDFAPLSLQIDIKGGFNMARKLIPNVPLVTMSAEGASYMTSLIGALYAALKGVGEDHDHAELLSLSGLGNRLCWTPGKWVFGNEMIDNNDEHPFEAQNRVLSAIGWKVAHTQVNRDGQGNPLKITDRQIRQDFVDSLDKGIPVLAQGITDDGCKHDYDVFYGYEDDGQKIVGWDYYQQGNDPFVRDNWERELRGYILLTEKTRPEPERERIVRMFKSLVEYSAKDEIRGKKVAFAAWAALLSDLESDDFLSCTVHPPEDEEERERQAQVTGVHNLEMRFIIYCDALTQIYQRRELAGYYKALAVKFPEWKGELEAAANAWDECGQYGGFLWSQGLSFDEAGYERFRTPEVRKALAEEGRRAMELDREAVRQIEKVLSRMAAD